MDGSPKQSGHLRLLCKSTLKPEANKRKIVTVAVWESCQWLSTGNCCRGKKKRGQRATGGEKGGKGLRHFSMKGSCFYRSSFFGLESSSIVSGPPERMVFTLFWVAWVTFFFTLHRSIESVQFADATFCSPIAEPSQSWNTFCSMYWT